MKLTVGQGLDPVYQLFRRLRYHFPQHYKSTTKLRDSVDRYISRYNDCLRLHQRTGKQRYLDAAQRELDSISDLLTLVEKQELMSILAGENRR